MESIVISPAALEDFQDLLDRKLAMQEDGKFPPRTDSTTSFGSLDNDWPQARAALEENHQLDDIARATLLISQLLNGTESPDGGWIGSVEEESIRRRSIEFLDQSTPGYALILGKVSEAEAVLNLIHALIEKKLYVFVAGPELPTLLRDSDLPLGWEGHLLLLGPASIDIFRALSILTRIARTFDDTDNLADLLQSVRTRLRGFTILLGEPSPDEIAVALGALSFGCPIVSNGHLPTIVQGWDAEHTGYRAAIDKLETAALAQVGIEERGLRIRLPLPALPIAYSADYAGEVVRGESVGADLRGAELVVMNQDITDGTVSIIGPDLDANLLEESPYALLVEVSGRAMKTDYESVLEREIESLLNEARGVMHRGQRSDTSLRIARGAIEKGFRLRHLGEILHARFHNEFGSIVSRVQVTIFTDPARVSDLVTQAKEIYDRRDARLHGLLDEDVDHFFSCSLCQSIAANHVCVISPEHPGACGAQDWLTTQAALSIRPVGPYRSTVVEGLIDPQRGQWESVNSLVRRESHGAIEAYNLYSLVEAPSTACGDFDCITVMLPSVNGVMVVARDYSGLTPCGMDFPTLHELVGIGEQTPGFLGHSKRLLTSRKYIAGDGGWRRIVWMNRSLREEMRPALDGIAAADGLAGFVDRIATEIEGVEEAQIQTWLESVDHPASALEPML